MSDIPVFMIANAVVTDAEEYRRYEKQFFPILKKYQGEFVTFDDNIINFEGESKREGRIVIFTFPSEELAKAWYQDPDYQRISEHRRAGTSTKFLTLVHGLPPR